MKTKLLKLIFGEKYKPQPWSFWKLFWREKFHELLKVSKISLKVLLWTTGIVLFIFLFIWFPSFLYLHKEEKTFELPKNQTNIITTQIQRTNAIIYAVNFKYQDMKKDFSNEFNYALNSYNSRLQLYHDLGGNWISLDEGIYWAIGRMKTLDEFSYSGQFKGDISPMNYPQSKKDIFLLVKKHNLGTFQNIKVTLPSGKFSTITNVTKIKTPLKDVDGGEWTITMLIVFLIDVCIFGIVVGIIVWLRINYEKMTAPFSAQKKSTSSKIRKNLKSKE